MKTQKEIDTLKRQVIRTELLDDKTLLVVSKSEEDKYPVVSVKYMENNQPHERNIAHLTPETIIRHNDRMVAILLPSGKVIKKPKVVSIYDVRKHDFTSQELLRMDYEIFSKSGAKVKQLINK